MKKYFKFMILALVAMCGFASCSEEHDDCIHVDHSADLVGTWTCFTSNYAEALVISADGTAISTGVEDGEYWENVRGTIKVENNKMTMTFEDNDNYEGSFDIIPGQAFSLVDRKTGLRFTYNYCANDLADEIVGMWVCTNAFTAAENDMLIQNFNEDGTSAFTGYVSEVNDFVSEVSGKTYKVFGDLVISIIPDVDVAQGLSRYTAMRLTYAPNGTEYGDIMTFTHYLTDRKKNSDAWLRIKQSLDLAGQKYDYIKTYVSNVKGSEKEHEFAGHKFSFATLNGEEMDKMMKNILFNVEFPAADTISYNCYYDGHLVETKAPIAVEGNQMTILMSKRNPVYRDVVLYAFQDVDNSQFHMYMSTSAFTNFFTNMSVAMLAQRGQLDITKQELVDELYQRLDAAIESINVSFVMSK
ncbi:MAG: hypothetical protein IKY31_05475 [Bacteroidaceae bacterium]|nr:hypothetical protein [Bacteroidaceae bacterium]